MTQSHEKPSFAEMRGPPSRVASFDRLVVSLMKNPTTTTPLSRDEIARLLSQHGVQATPQRIAVASFVLVTDRHPTADEVLAETRERLPNISQATVYNTLGKFVDVGLVSQVQRPGDKVRYDGNTAPHHHFFDRDTGRIYDIEPDQVKITINGELLDGVDVSRASVFIEGSRRSAQ